MTERERPASNGSHQTSMSASIRLTTTPVRVILLFGCVFVFVAGLQLYFLPDQTENLFAWTIEPPLSAAFLGGFYWTALVLAFRSQRERVWAHARVGVGGILLFTALTMVATYVHLDRFHLASPNPITASVAWIWLVVYLVLPPALLVASLLQLRTPGGDPPRVARPAAWFRIGIGIHAALLFVVGIVLFVAPAVVDTAWPWQLTPLVARAMAAWLLGLACVLAQAIREDDWRRLEAATLSYVVLGALQLLAVVRFSDDIRWGNATAALYLAFLISALVLGGAGYLSAVRSRGREVADPARPPESA